MMTIRSKGQHSPKLTGPLIRFLAGVSLSIGCIASLQAEENTVFEDWVRQCEEQDDFAGRCFIRQTLTLKTNGTRLFEIAAGYPLGGEYPLLLLSAPLGMFLPPGIVLSVDETESFKAIIAYCNSEGCHAYYRMTRSFYDRFRNGRWLNVSFQDGTRRNHRFQISLNGFSAAIDSLKTR